MLYPTYTLNKLEWYILDFITIIIIRLLEQSLINHFKPYLNYADKVIIPQMNWPSDCIEIVIKLS